MKNREWKSLAALAISAGFVFLLLIVLLIVYSCKDVPPDVPPAPTEPRYKQKVWSWMPAPFDSIHGVPRWYVFYRGKESGKYTVELRSDTTFVKDDSVDGCFDWFAAVKAFNNAGGSEFSNEIKLDKWFDECPHPIPPEIEPADTLFFSDVRGTGFSLEKRDKWGTTGCERDVIGEGLIQVKTGSAVILFDVENIKKLSWVYADDGNGTETFVVNKDIRDYTQNDDCIHMDSYIFPEPFTGELKILWAATDNGRINYFIVEK